MPTTASTDWFVQPRSTPTSLILDVMMPGLDGHEVAQYLRAIPTLAEVPIVFCTSLSDREAQWYGYQNGASSYLAQPVRPDLMAAELDRIHRHSLTGT